jgi:hypothetical protein
MLLIFLSLLNIVVPRLFARHYCFCVFAQCGSSFRLARHYSSVPCSTLQFLTPGFSFLLQHCCFCTLCSTLLLLYPCSKLLLLNPCLTLQLLCSLFDVAIPTFLVHLQHSLLLLRYLSTTP